MVAAAVSESGYGPSVVWAIAGLSLAFYGHG
jgi:hypothetical protein